MMKIRSTETEGVTKIWKNFMSQQVILNCDHSLECVRPVREYCTQHMAWCVRLGEMVCVLHCVV